MPRGRRRPAATDIYHPLIWATNGLYSAECVEGKFSEVRLSRFLEVPIRRGQRFAFSVVYLRGY